MKKPVFLWLILVILLGVNAQIVVSQSIGTASLPLCDDQIVRIGQNCTIITPVLNCSSFTYDIVNFSGVEVVNDAPLTELNQSIFFLNFTQTEAKGDFVVRLCDGVTREVRVRGSDDLTTIAISILIMGIIFVLYKASVELDERHWPLKMGLFFGSIILGWAALNIALRMAIDIASSVELRSNLETIYTAYIFISLLAFGYMIIVILWYFFRRMKPSEEPDQGW